MRKDDKREQKEGGGHGGVVERRIWLVNYYD
jgi:hypothetical protein